MYEVNMKEVLALPKTSVLGFQPEKMSSQSLHMLYMLQENKHSFESMMTVAQSTRAVIVSEENADEVEEVATFIATAEEGFSDKGKQAAFKQLLKENNPWIAEYAEARNAQSRTHIGLAHSRHNN